VGQSLFPQRVFEQEVGNGIIVKQERVAVVGHGGRGRRRHGLVQGTNYRAGLDGLQTENGEGSGGRFGRSTRPVRIKQVAYKNVCGCNAFLAARTTDPTPAYPYSTLGTRYGFSRSRSGSLLPAPAALKKGHDIVSVNGPIGNTGGGGK
jgi:hypothetical protein